MNTQLKFLILGANSFSGASFTDFLLQNEVPVIATSRSKQPHEAFLPYLWTQKSSQLYFHEIDLNKNLEKLELLLRSEKPTHVVNFAAQAMVGQSWDTPEHWMQTNVVATTQLFNMLRRYEHLEKYVHVTTPEVYGTTNGWTAETNYYKPSTPYAVSRAAADLSLQTFVDQYNFPAVMTRAANVYGPGQQLYRIIPRTILAGIKGQKLTLDGGGLSERVFIHIKDVCSATYDIALNGNIGEVFHISGYDLISIRTCVEKILNKLGKNFNDCVSLGPERMGKDTAYMLDSEKLRKTLKWEDVIALDEGIDDTITWMKKYHDVLDILPTSYVHKQ